jgi:hypothetical protein
MKVTIVSDTPGTFEVVKRKACDQYSYIYKAKHGTGNAKLETPDLKLSQLFIKSHRIH